MKKYCKHCNGRIGNNEHICSPQKKKMTKASIFKIVKLKDNSHVSIVNGYPYCKLHGHMLAVNRNCTIWRCGETGCKTGGIEYISSDKIRPKKGDFRVVT